MCAINAVFKHLIHINLPLITWIITWSLHLPNTLLQHTHCYLVARIKFSHAEPFFFLLGTCVTYPFNVGLKPASQISRLYLNIRRHIKYITLNSLSKCYNLVFSVKAATLEHTFNSPIPSYIQFWKGRKKRTTVALSVAIHWRNIICKVLAGN